MKVLSFHKTNLLFLFVLVFSLGLQSSKAQTVLFDDFQRADNNAVGMSWVETETVASTSASILSNQLRLGSTTAGRDYVLADISSLYNSVLNTNTSSLTWSFNMRQTRTDPSGFDAGNYGVAFVLGCATNNFLTGSGYAIVLGNSGTSDNLRLVRFANGIATNAGTTTIISTTPDYGADYLTVKVVYNPIGNNWSLFIGSNLAAFVDPTAASYTQIGVTTSDNTYTGSDLLYMGCFWNHSIGASDFAYFDNINIPSLCSLAPEPSTQASALSVASIGANTLTLNWTRGNGSECIVIARQGGAVTALPADGSAYPANTIFGSGTAVSPGQFAVYTGSAGTCVISGLLPSTPYYFSVFEYNGSACTVNYLLGIPAISNATTIACIIATQPALAPTSLTASNILSNSLDLNWTRGDGSFCILIGKAGSAITAPPVDGISYSASSTFGVGSITAPGEFVLYSGTGNSVALTGLFPSTSYFFEVFEFNGSGCISNYFLNSAALNVSSMNAVTYNFYYGNLHSHSDYSDGDIDNVCNGALSATCCYDIGNTALNFNYMGLSDHNHNEGPVMTLAKYASGVSEAASYNSTHSDFVALYGMEWGTISTGGHANVYGINQLVGWNSGNYSIYCAKGDYSTLFNLVASTPNAFATLNHPNSTDFGNISGSAYNTIYDNAIIGVALRNGPYNSLSTSYNDPSNSNYVSYYHNLLAKGYHLGPLADLDNHNSATMGKSSQQRTVLLATALTKPAILDAILNMRFYATDDFNMQASFKINGSLNMGSIAAQFTNPALSVTASDPDGDAITSIKIYYGIPGSNVAPTLLTSVSNAASLNYTHSFASGTYYYYAEITEADGNLTWTAPIWYTKNVTLPVQLLSFSGYRNKLSNQLLWLTASETNSDYFTIERSTDGANFSSIGQVKGAGSSNSTIRYEFEDNSASAKYNYYRLKQTDYNGNFEYSSVLLIESKAETELKIRPNPAKEEFSIDLSDIQENSIVRIFSLEGKILMQQNAIPGQVNRIAVKNLAAGMYLLQLITKDKILTQKLVLEN
jgi:Secretion system C-terminal sorting domain